MASANNIVQINVSIINPPAPSLLQRTGAFVTQGGTTTAAGTLTLLTGVGDLAAILGVTHTAAADELDAMNTTFFAQGGMNSIYVLELGYDATVAAGVTDLTAFITDNPDVIYSFLMPRAWDGEATFHTMVANYNAPSTAVNFFVTTTTTTYDDWSQLDNCVFAMVEAPATPATEFSCAAPFYVTLAWNPSSAQKVPPLAFSYIYGVTAYPLRDNLTLLTQLKAANIGYVDTGAEGGLVNTLIKWGHVLGGNPFNYWYTADWAKITLELDLANEIINGSNNSIAPLYYNQNGIDRLQNRAAQTLRNGVSYGLVLGSVIMVELDPTVFAAQVANGDYNGNAVINAVPFPTYTTNNPSDYAIGKYSGLQAAITPARGFEAIIFSLNIANFAS